MSSEFTENLALSRHELDRDYLSRSRPDLFGELWADSSTRVVLLWNGTALLSADASSDAGLDAGSAPSADATCEAAALALRAPADVPEAELLLYLGRSIDGAATPYVAAVLSDDAASTLGGGAAWGNLRELGSSLSDLETGLLTEALALANWHASHEFSPRTGQAVSSALGGWVRRAEGDGNDLFPRTDAAVIVGVTDPDDRILLGSNALWKSNRYSLLAGFVEPGESLENAVVREVFEEAGIRVTNPVYLGSQPWPFPASLMVGFRATTDETQASKLAPDGEEILDLRWFTRKELAVSLDEIVLPGATSIARAIIEDWFGGPIVDSRKW